MVQVLAAVLVQVWSMVWLTPSASTALIEDETEPPTARSAGRLATRVAVEVGLGAPSVPATLMAVMPAGSLVFGDRALPEASVAKPIR